jgi:hypothetical protein
MNFPHARGEEAITRNSIGAVPSGSVRRVIEGAVSAA